MDGFFQESNACKKFRAQGNGLVENITAGTVYCDHSVASTGHTIHNTKPWDVSAFLPVHTPPNHTLHWPKLGGGLFSQLQFLRFSLTTAHSWVPRLESWTKMSWIWLQLITSHYTLIVPLGTRKEKTHTLRCSWQGSACKVKKHTSLWFPTGFHYQLALQKTGPPGNYLLYLTLVRRARTRHLLWSPQPPDSAREHVKCSMMHEHCNRRRISLQARSFGVTCDLAMDVM